MTTSLTPRRMPLRSWRLAIGSPAQEVKAPDVLLPRARLESDTVYWRAGASWIGDVEDELVGFPSRPG